MSEITQKIYRPTALVGQVYARPYGTDVLPMPIGNVLELKLEHEEDVQTQEDMTMLGGGVHAERRRVKGVKISMKLADLNATNLARATQATIEAVAAGAIVDEPHTAMLGGLVRLAHIQPTDVVLKKGATALGATAVPAAGNYEVRPEGLFLSATATGITNAEKLWVSYSHSDYAALEAMTTPATELELTFAGLNEADSGKPAVLEIWRASQGVTKSLELIGKGFGALDVTGSVLMDPTKTGVGVSRYYKQSFV